MFKYNFSSGAFWRSVSNLRTDIFGFDEPKYFSQCYFQLMREPNI